jgi:hypothetical protein
MTTSAVDLLNPIVSGDLRNWRGLPSGLTIAGLTSAFPRDSDWAGTEQLGGLHRETHYLWVHFPAADGKLRSWFDSERVIQLDLAYSGVQTSRNELAELLDETPVALDTWQGTLHMPESELVFATHGLAAFLNRETGLIWHLALFAPVSLEEYVDDLRIDMQTRRHQPLRR